MVADRSTITVMSPTDQSTRDRIIEAATRHMVRKGYHPTGMKDVLAEAAVPKGSFYHWFASKEDLGLTVLERYVHEYDAFIGSVLDDPTHKPLDRLRRFFAEGLRRFTEVGAVDGCLVGNFGQELADQDETFRVALSRALQGWTDQIARTLDEAVREGQLEPGLDTGELACFLLDAWEGALLRMKVDASVEPLRTFQRVTFDALLRRGRS